MSDPVTAHLVSHVAAHGAFYQTRKWPRNDPRNGGAPPRSGAGRAPNQSASSTGGGGQNLGAVKAGFAKAEQHDRAVQGHVRGAIAELEKEIRVLAAAAAGTNDRDMQAQIQARIEHLRKAIELLKGPVTREIHQGSSGVNAKGRKL